MVQRITRLNKYVFFAFAVPAFQFLGAMPLAVLKGSMSRLVEPQEQGKFIGEV